MCGHFATAHESDEGLFAIQVRQPLVLSVEPEREYMR